MSETSEYAYELRGPDPTEDLYWLGQRGRPVIRRCCGERLRRSQSWIVHAPHIQEQLIYLVKLSRRADILMRAGINET